MIAFALMIIPALLCSQTGEHVDARQPTRFPEVGLRLVEPTAALLERYGLDPLSRGLLIRGVDPDGRADQGGLEIGMLITDAAGHKITTLAEFRAALAHQKPNTDLIVRIMKKSKAEFRVLVHQ